LATPADAIAVWIEINRACLENKTKKVLAEMNIPNPVLPIADVFKFSEQIGVLKWPPGIAIALGRNKGIQADYKFA
jgi:hypothetical protein